MAVFGGNTDRSNFKIFQYNILRQNINDDRIKGTIYLNVIKYQISKILPNL